MIPILALVAWLRAATRFDKPVVLSAKTARLIADQLEQQERISA